MGIAINNRLSKDVARTRHKGAPAKMNSYSKRKSQFSSDNPNRTIPKKQNAANMRDASSIKRLQMYKGGKPIRNRAGHIVGGSLMCKDKAGGKNITAESGRIQPDRRWFGNTRLIGQKELDTFRDKMVDKQHDPYTVVLHQNKLPMGLLQDSAKTKKMNMLEVESFEETYGTKKTRRKPKLGVSDLGELAKAAQDQSVAYDITKDINVEVFDVMSGRNKTGYVLQEKKQAPDEVFSKGQSKRIWEELYKVIDSSDVVIQVVDARNVPGTRSFHIEKYLAKHAKHKHLIIVVNKCDLVPTWVTRKWVQLLSEKHPTLAFHASVSNPFGKGSLIQLLRQFAKLHQDKKQISVGIIGYPNVGKSSVINTLRRKIVCNVAPVPGETKVWQYVALMRRIFLIDCPGHVYDEGDSQIDIVLKGVVRAEKLSFPQGYIPEIMRRVKKEYLQRTYGVLDWKDPVKDDGKDFMSKVAVKMGRILKGDEPDTHCVAVQMINDWQRGKLPFFIPPPNTEEPTKEELAAERDAEKAAEDEDDDEDDEEEEMMEEDGEEDDEEEDDEEGDSEEEDSEEEEEPDFDDLQ
jgi:nuclear GTP-binding protein